MCALRIGLAVLLLATVSPAETAVTVAGSGRIVTPLTITSPVALRFGNVASSASAGTVSVNSSGARSATGGAALVSGGAISAGLISVLAGEIGRLLNVSYPGSVTLNSGADTVTVDNFVVEGSPISLLLDGSGLGSFNLGGRLSLAGSQPAGTYLGTVVVTLSYQ